VSAFFRKPRLSGLGELNFINVGFFYARPLPAGGADGWGLTPRLWNESATQKHAWPKPQASCAFTWANTRGRPTAQTDSTGRIDPRKLVKPGCETFHLAIVFQNPNSLEKSYLWMTSVSQSLTPEGYKKSLLILGGKRSRV